MVFLPKGTDGKLAQQCQDILSEAVAHYGMRVCGWRDVPCDDSCLGELARAAEPAIRQAFIDGCGMAEDVLERRLFLARKRAERLARERLGQAGERLLRAEHVLPHDRLQGHVHGPAVVRLLSGPGRSADADGPGDRPPALQHQHVPQLAAGPAVPHASPTTGRSTPSAATATAWPPGKASSPAPCWGRTSADLLPVLTPGGSDSACFDNALELLVQRRPIAAARHDDDDPRGLRAPATTSAPTSGRSTSTTPPSWSRGTARRPWSSRTAGSWAARWTATACGRRGTW